MTYEAIIYITNSIRVMVEADDEEMAEEIIEDRLSSGEYDDEISEAVGTYSEHHSIDLIEC